MNSKITLRSLDVHVTGSTPVRVVIPSEWLADYEANSPKVQVEICGLIFKQADMQVMLTTTEHGRTRWLDSDLEVEITDPIINARPHTYTRARTVRGVSID